MGSIPGRGRFCMLGTNWARGPQPLSPSAATARTHRPTARAPQEERPEHCSQEWLAAIREGSSKATKTQHSQKQTEKLKGNLIPVLDTLDSHFYFNMKKRTLTAINVSLVMVSDQIKSICPLTPKSETSYFLLWYLRLEFFSAMAWLPFTFDKLVNDQKEHF